jgi:hypothetical protein
MANGLRSAFGVKSGGTFVEVRPVRAPYIIPAHNARILLKRLRINDFHEVTAERIPVLGVQREHGVRPAANDQADSPNFRASITRTSSGVTGTSCTFAASTSPHASQILRPSCVS